MQRKDTNRTLLKLRTAGLIVMLALVISPVVGSQLTSSSGSQSGVVFAADTPTTEDTSDTWGNDPSRTKNQKCANGTCIIENYIQPALNLLAAVVGLSVTISIIAAGIRYATSADSPQKVSEAKQRIVNSIFVLIGFFTFYALMKFLLPGGLL